MMNYVEGMIYQQDGFRQGYFSFSDGIVVEVGHGNAPEPNKTIAKGLVLPLLTNCHTHIGDAIARGQELTGDVSELVAPPNGLKFRILRNSKPAELTAAMHQAIKEMLDSGTGMFCDFREEGLEGVKLLNQAISDLPINPIIMGRPKGLEYSKDELAALLPKVSGLGVSSISDWEYPELEKVARETKAVGKLFAMHASECAREDIDLILDLKPDFLIHMTYASESDYEKIAELGIPIVLCVRSNIFFKNIPNIPKMLEKGVTLLLGSDNAMINSSNLFEELKAAYELSNQFDKVEPKTILKMVTLNPNKILNPKDYVNLAPGTPSNFMVLDKSGIGQKPEEVLVKGIEAKDIQMINIGTMIWKK